MTQVSPEEIKPGQKIVVDWSYSWSYGAGSGIQRDIFVVERLEPCSSREITDCRCEGEVCCKYRIVKNSISKWCTRTTDRKFYLAVDLSKINKITEV